ncbi:hypothetical protein HK099_002917 [Clydaea vesicula]|uniref:DNA-directed primase/polymerase protein n=1 Tax=Clydaea vesicula TaxID=447962 RepID=A0AAD5UB75_9FUNG|nr:hypothetical protein HK099_002917 [Clydaea vesicula]
MKSKDSRIPLNTVWNLMHAKMNTVYLKDYKRYAFQIYDSTAFKKESIVPKGSPTFSNLIDVKEMNLAAPYRSYDFFNIESNINTTANIPIIFNFGSIFHERRLLLTPSQDKILDGIRSSLHYSNPVLLSIAKRIVARLGGSGTFPRLPKQHRGKCKKFTKGNFGINDTTIAINKLNHCETIRRYDGEYKKFVVYVATDYRGTFQDNPIFSLLPQKFPCIYSMNDFEDEIYISKELETQPNLINKENLNSFDSSKPGKRKFLVATIDQFWNYYKRLLENSRHFYEIICEDVSSKLYFDVEYEINDYNKNLNSTELIGIFKNEVLKELNFQFKLENLEQDEVILDLDSSTSEKFSRHLIFNIPGHIFKNNYVVGHFVSNLIQKIKIKIIEKKDNYLELQKLFIHNYKDNMNEIFIDQGVYTKNRQFRLFLSSKINKNTFLNISKIESFHSKLNKKTIFMKSLISIPNINLTKFKILETFNSFEKKNSEYSVAQCLKTDSLKTTNNSVFPDLDKYILEKIKENVNSFNIRFRSAIWYNDSNTIVYFIEGSKYCYNILREHQSNSVYYIVDLKKNTFYQKCFDPDCKNFRSHQELFPSELNPFTDNEEILIEA